METTREIALRTYKDATAHGMMDTPMNWHIWKRAFDTAERELKNLQLGAVITPFWLWLVREAKIEVIDAENYIEVHGFAKEGDNLIPVISFAELLEWYKSQNEW